MESVHGAESVALGPPEAQALQLARDALAYAAHRSGESGGDGSGGAVPDAAGPDLDFVPELGALLR